VKKNTKNQKTEFELAIEKELGESVEIIRSTPIDDQRRRAEKQYNQPTEFRSYFPVIGRGNVLRDRTSTHEEVEIELDKALKV
jgi:hypothetical protein